MSGWWNPLRPVRFVRGLWSEWLMPSSKVTILAIIASLNAVWGYPLVGLLASLLTLLCVAALASWLLRPRLSAAMKMPELVCANSSIQATLSIENKAPTPVFDLALSLTALPRGWVTRNGQQSRLQVNPGESFKVSCTVQVAGRGEFQWPTLRCESTCPFSFFCTRQDIAFNSTTSTRGGRTWVTPELIESDIPELVQSLLSRGQLGDGVRTGESLEYLGSREYCYGTFAKRWDFASWARLGRPIVRQFDQSSTSDVTIVVDTFLGSRPIMGQWARVSFQVSPGSRSESKANLSRQFRTTICVYRIRRVSVR